MLALGRFSLVVLLASFLAFECCYGQPGGGWGGDRGGFGGDRGGWGGDRGGWGGDRGGWGGDRGGFRGGGFPGGGYPGGGFPGGPWGGGFPGGGMGDPREMVRRADANNNNMIEPDEFQNGFGRMVRFMAERAGLNTNQALRVDEIVAAVERSRGGTSPSSSSSGGSPSQAATTNPQAFGTQTQVTLVPGFDTAPGTTAQQAQIPLEKRFDERVMERAKSRIQELDRNGNGTLEGEELANYRGDPPIMMSDLNKDNVINLEEMAMRYQARSGGSSYGGPGGPGGPPGYAGGYPGSSSSGSSSWGPRPPFPTSSPTVTAPTTTSSSLSSSSSSNDRFREFAESMIRRSDRNGNGKLEKDEWGGLRDGGEGVDKNNDGVITVDELADRMRSRMSGGGPDGGSGRDRGSDRDRGGDRGSDRDRGGDRGRGGFGGDRGGDRGGFDRGGFGGGPPGGFRDRGGFGGGPPGGGFGGDRGGFGGDSGGFGGDSSGGFRDRGSDYTSNGSGSGNGSNGSSSTGANSAPPPRTSYRVTTATELLPKGLDSWFTRSDTDGDGQVSMSEYAAKWDADVAKKFQQLDANGDGFISADEALRAGPSSSKR